ncbi:19079_t:CDS:2, partial [Dentiscutata erythropus]
QQLARQLHFISIYPNINECKWSNKWLDGFMHRYKLSNRCRTTVAQKLPEDLELKINQFLNFSNFTGCMANGVKLPPVIVFKLVNVPWQEFPSGVIIRTNPAGYMNSDEMI